MPSLLRSSPNNMSSTELAQEKNDGARSPAPTQHDVGISSGAKYTLLVIFCFAQFLDAFSNSSLFAAIPPIAQQLNISNATSVWMISAYQLTFAAFLLSVSSWLPPNLDCRNLLIKKLLVRTLE